MNWPKGEMYRLDYDLNAKSVVLDCGGYHGEFAKAISEKFGCRVHVFEPVTQFYHACVENLKPFPNVTVHKQGMNDFYGYTMIHVQDDSTGLYSSSKTVEECEFITIPRAMVSLTIPEIDLIKLNIEGSEFDVLEHSILNSYIRCLKNIQVQFHPVVQDCENRYQRIRERLQETHHTTFDHGWTWQNWRLNGA